MIRMGKSIRHKWVSVHGKQLRSTTLFSGQLSALFSSDLGLIQEKRHWGYGNPFSNMWMVDRVYL